MSISYFGNGRSHPLSVTGVRNDTNENKEKRHNRNTIARPSTPCTAVVIVSICVWWNSCEQKGKGSCDYGSVNHIVNHFNLSRTLASVPPPP
ncbi:hypothetical protein, unlikely [Trypanosoma brucei gambiense DAL972]|nr:hypothetical protein, unlikely [Trypanosoma brucei gambiense DAL972]CBH08921.1 hypothetical protein, unlikely [Trypanosoma brucei gambiense DAL972]|eukprot:XP_011771362.1 hypothetical protein, unlikely [Trypanosoma brucei gambiense DAL972]